MSNLPGPGKVLCLHKCLYGQVSHVCYICWNTGEIPKAMAVEIALYGVKNLRMSTIARIRKNHGLPHNGNYVNTSARWP